MFNGARNVVVTSGSFVVNAASSTKSGMDRLLDTVAPNAILNAGGRADEVRCYPGTREEVIGKVEKWMYSEGSRGRRMMWLSGPAGAGKSAISQTIAERCRERGIPAANFFFFRGDGTRNNSQPLVATLVYQLRRLYPAIDQPLHDCLTADPLICGAPTEEQFQQLISSPMRAIQQSSSIRPPIILVIDGLDECDDKMKQEHILLALHTLAEADHSPFLVLVASRAEPHLVMSFNKFGNSVKSIFLDSEYRPQDDIRRFVVAKFNEIKKTHHLAQTLSRDWPAKADIEAITDKSSGQFIYAATVMRFIQNSPGSPALSLLTVLGVHPSAGHSHLAQLDALYSYIFSKTQDVKVVKLILGAYFMGEQRRSGDSSDHNLQLVGYTAIEVQSIFAELAAIIQVSPGSHIHLVFYHASMTDYLKDKSRSEIYHVDMDDVAAELSSICLRNFYDQASLVSTVFALCHVKEATPELSKALVDASQRRFENNLVDMYHLHLIMVMIEKLYFEKNTALFKLMVQSWIRFAYLNNIDLSTNIFVQSTRASWYYKWYRATNKVKFALRRN